MAGLPRWIIKKYGVSKKAWAVFRGGSRPATKRRKRGIKMARRKRYGRRGGSKKFFGLSTRGLIGGLGLLGVGAGIFFADEIANMIPVDVPAKPYLVSFALGGPAAVAGKVGKDMLLGGGINLGTSTSTGGKLF